MVSAPCSVPSPSTENSTSLVCGAGWRGEAGWWCSCLAVWHRAGLIQPSQPSQPSQQGTRRSGAPRGACSGRGAPRALAAEARGRLTATLLAMSMLCVKAPSLTNSRSPSFVFLEPCAAAGGRWVVGWSGGWVLGWLGGWVVGWRREACLPAARQLVGLGPRRQRAAAHGAAGARSAGGRGGLTHGDGDGGVEQPPAAGDPVQVLRRLLHRAVLLQLLDERMDLLLARRLRRAHARGARQPLRHRAPARSRGRRPRAARAPSPGQQPAAGQPAAQRKPPQRPTCTPKMPRSMPSSACISSALMSATPALVLAEASAAAAAGACGTGRGGGARRRRSGSERQVLG